VYLLQDMVYLLQDMVSLHKIHLLKLHPKQALLPSHLRHLQKPHQKRHQSQLQKQLPSQLQSKLPSKLQSMQLHHLIHLHHILK